MCRMTIYKGLGLEESILLSDLIVKPLHSIIHQSYNCRERFHDTGLPPQLNADGFGIGWYAEPMYTLHNHPNHSSSNESHEKQKNDAKKRKRNDVSNGALTVRNRQYETPCVFASVTPAWNNRNLYQLAEKVRSPLMFAHVRAASAGSPTTEANCHPFTFDKFLWMHNGGIGDFHLIKRRLVAELEDVAYDMMQGNTDSEHCFALFITELLKLGSLEEAFPPSSIHAALESCINRINVMCTEAEIKTPSLLNFAVTDGDTLVASRYVNDADSNAASLYFSSGSKWTQSVERPKEYIMQRSDNIEKVFVMASERLSLEVQDWVEVPKNHMVIVNADMNIQIHPILDKLS